MSKLRKIPEVIPPGAVKLSAAEMNKIAFGTGRHSDAHPADSSVTIIQPMNKKTKS
ncbi:MAG: hypothetical protein HFJ91_09725 [Muribaculaceae bacterium]|nr:hypothetical protein [Muribaculaceae bacterium]